MKLRRCYLCFGTIESNINTIQSHLDVKKNDLYKYIFEHSAESIEKVHNFFIESNESTNVEVIEINVEHIENLQYIIQEVLGNKITNQEMVDFLVINEEVAEYLLRGVDGV